MEKQISLNIDDTSFFQNILYGKKEEHDKFLSAIANFEQGVQTIIYVHGEIGVGKSYFIQNIYNSLTDYNILFGKYEKFKLGIPYYGIKQVFNTIIKQILKLPLEKQNVWKESLDSQFSSYYSELVSVVPNFDKILTATGDNKPINTSSILLENRINDVLLNFIKFYIEHVSTPTILTIENIHWIDIDSLNLIKNLISKNHKNLLVVFSKRNHSSDNSCKDLTPFIQSATISKITFDIELKPLYFPEMSDIFDEMFDSESKGLNYFKDFCFSKSDGNIQLLKTIFSRFHQNEKLNFNPKSNTWEIDFEKIEDNDSYSQESTESLFYQLADTDKTILEISSCFGSNLNTAFISRICELPIIEINNTYQKALKIGVIKPAFIADKDISYSEGIQLGFDSPNFLKGEDGSVVITNFEFCSDLFQDKIKNSFDIKDRREIHKKIGNYYIQSSVLGLKDRDVFDAVFHINKSIFEGSTLKQKQDHANINLKAAKQAKKTASNTTAMNHISECMKYDMHRNWKDAYDTSSEIHVLGYEISRLTQQKDIAINLYSEALNNCNKIDINRLKLEKIIVDIQYGELKEALTTGVSALKSIGININARANKLTILKEFVKTRVKMINHNAKTILALPELHDENSKLAQEIIFWMFRSAQYINPELNGVLALKSLQLTLGKGTNGNSYSGFMAYGVIIGAGTNNYNSAYTYCNIGNLLAEKYDNHSGSVQFGKAIYSAFKFSLKDTLEYYNNAKLLSLKNGDFLAATESTANESLTHLGAGLPLYQVENKINDNIVFCDELNMDVFKDFQIILKFKIRLLQGIKGTAEEIKNFNLILKHSTYNFTNVASDVLEIQRLCLTENWNLASDLAHKITKGSQVLIGLHIFTEYNFYYALSLINQLNNLSGYTKFRAKRKIKSIINNMTKWADSAPENHEHKLEFLIGLLHSKNGDIPSAISMMLKSAEKAEDLGFIQNSALIYANLSNVYLQKNDIHNSDLCKVKSDELYNKWGFKSLS